MTTTAELNRRLDAVARFDGRIQLPMFEHGGKEIEVPPRAYNRSWDALMPVVEKIERENNLLEVGTDVYGKYVWYITGTGESKYYWHVFDLLDVERERLNLAHSYRDAYFLAVSDYCLSLIETI